MLIKNNEYTGKLAQNLHTINKCTIKLDDGTLYPLLLVRVSRLADIINKHPDIVGKPTMLASHGDDYWVFPRPDKDYEAELVGSVLVLLYM